MTKAKRLLDKPTADKLEKIHSQLESYFGVSREDYTSNQIINMVIIRNIGCYVALELEKINQDLVAQSFKRDRTTMYHMLKTVDTWFDLPAQYPNEYSTVTGFISSYKGHTDKELRVYLVDDEDDDEMTDDEFMLNAEAVGKVYTLAGFQEAYNNREFVFTQYSIRIIGV
jgi:hypothetical protein